MSFDHIKAVFFDLGYTLIEYGDHDWRLIDLQGRRDGYNDLVRLGCRLPAFDEFNERLEYLIATCRPADREALVEWRATDAPEALLKELGVNDPIEKSHRFIAMVYAAAQQYMHVCDGGLDTLKQLKEVGYICGVISNTLYSSDLLEADLDRLSLRPFLDINIYSNVVGYRKPHPAIFQAAVDRTGLRPEEIIYVGDRYRVDIIGSQKAGMQPILKFREGMNYPDPLPPDLPVIHHLPQLIRRLSSDCLC